MFLIKLENLAPLYHATSLFSQIANKVDLKFSRLAFSIIARHPSPRFDAVMFMMHQLFANYSVDHHHISTVSLQNFHKAILESQKFSSLTIQLAEQASCISLSFDTSRYVPRLGHELTLSPTENVDFGEISNAKSFSIDTEEFKRIIIALSNYDDHTICITITHSQVKFSVASEEIILSKEEGECIIFGDGEVETQLLITLHPISFFMNLATQAQRVSFFKTTDARSVINFPFHVHAQYLVYFPQV